MQIIFPKNKIKVIFIEPDYKIVNKERNPPKKDKLI